MKNIEFDLFDIIAGGIPDLEKYDIVGFAAFTNFWGIPHIFQTFMEKLPQQDDKPAFVFNTYGFISGKTLLILDKLVTEKGFLVIAGHSLHAPESYPPMIVKGMGNQQAPNEKEMRRFNKFISELDLIISDGRKLNRKNIWPGFLNRLLPAFSVTKARKDMGEKFVDEVLCIECGLCEKLCPYKAIRCSPKPVFDMNNCYGCWICYNHCPEKAIYTSKYRGAGHYPKPINQLKEKLKV